MKKPRKILKAILSNEIAKTVLLWTCICAAIFIIFSYILTLNQIPSGSMENTIMTGDLLIGTRYDRTDISRYDIVVFIPPDKPDEFYIKRVIGLPGETILVENGKVYADGVLLDDSFIAEDMEIKASQTFEVPDGCYFMMGDNRNHSLDSRLWHTKYVPAENIVAKAKLRIYPLNTFGSITYKEEK
jgi:signal peptidase I